MSRIRNTDFKTSYLPLHYNDNLEEDDENLSPDDPNDVLTHVVPPFSSKKRWNHIEDLDSFFQKIYHYHQNHGFSCMILKHFFGLCHVIFLISLIVFLCVFLNYGALFHFPNKEKTHLSEVVYSWSEVTFPLYIQIIVFLAVVFFVLRSIDICFTLLHFSEIRSFYNTALGIKDCDLENVTWDEVQQHVMEVQVEQRMCIQKESLTELDIYHRILRFDNYFIAMVNKEVLPLKVNIPFIGEVKYLTNVLRFNLDKILFTGPWAPFHNNWQLRDEYKLSENRHRLADELSKKFFYFSIVNIILLPFILVWQLFRIFYHNCELITKDPGVLGLQRWSDYSQVYLRHFNELNHELHARLSRGYRPAVHYMDTFTNPFVVLIAKNVSFQLAIIFVLLTGLALIDEDVLLVQHILLLMTFCGVCAKNLQKLIPDPNMVMVPELLMTRVLAEAHYLPDSWKGKSHTKHVRNSFSELFEYRATKVLKETFSPVMTPVMLFFMRQKSLEIVDFLRNFTVEVVGVGDICSFAQMDIRKHGSPTWQPYESDCAQSLNTNKNDFMRIDGGKTELSLLHFTLTNPRWKPPQESSTFLAALKTQAQKDFNLLNTVQEENALSRSINGMSFGGGLGTIGASILRTPWLAAHNALPGYQPEGFSLNQLEGSQYGHSNGILASVSQSLSNSCGLISDPVLNLRNEFVHARPLGMTAVDMGISTLYLHDLHNRKRVHEKYSITVVPVHYLARPHDASEGAGQSNEVNDGETDNFPQTEEETSFPQS